MRLVLHSEIPQDPELEAGWRSLIRQVEQPQIFYTHEWASAVARSHPQTLRPLLFTAWDGGKLMGVVALAGDFDRRKATFLSATTADYCDFICPREYRAQFISQVLGQLEELGLLTLVLANLPEDSATAPILRRLSGSRGYSVLARPGYRCAQVNFKNPSDRTALQSASQQKQIVRRHLKALAKLGPVEVKHLTNFEEIEPALASFCETHVGRFLATGRRSNLASSERRAFITELAHRFSGREGVVLSLLTVQGRAIAWNYGFRYAGAWFWYQPTFDAEYQSYSPGLCLLAKILEQAAGDPTVGLVDLGLGEEDYKQRWANRTRNTVHVTASKSSVAFCRETLRYYLSVQLQKSPAADRVIRRWATALARVGGKQRQVSSITERLRRRFTAWLRDDAKVLFFEKGPHQQIIDAGSRVVPMTLNLLARAAMIHDQDPETLTYLLRSAKRIGGANCQGFVLIDGDEFPLHFCWSTQFHNFYLAELKRTVSPPQPNSVLIFDCWTPRAIRGKGHYSAAISQVAEKLSDSAAHVWIFAAEQNQRSITGIRNAGFLEKFAITLRRSGFRTSAFYSQSVSRNNAEVSTAPAA